MDTKQTQHAIACLNLFVDEGMKKYAKGQVEHGGNMWEKPGMLHNSYMELIDMLFYISSVGTQIQMARDFLEYKQVDQAKKILDGLLAETKN